MDELIVDDDAQGWRRLRGEVGAYAFSPDGQWLAVSEPFGDAMGQSLVRVVEVETGRVAMSIRGREVAALAFASPEHLLVVRAADLGCRAVLHLVPDGGVVATVALPGLRTARCRVSLATSWGGGVSPFALVTPLRWLGGDRRVTRRLHGAVLRLPSLEALASVDPDALPSQATLPHAPSAVATLSPDGDRVAMWVSAPQPRDALVHEEGALHLIDWARAKDERVCVVGREVDDVIAADASRWVLRSGHFSADIAGRGDIAVVDTGRGVVLHDTSIAAALDEAGSVGAWATVDLHPDRERVLVAGRAAAGGRVTARPTWEGALRAVDVTGASRSRPAVMVKCKAQVAMSAVYEGEGDALWALTGKAATMAELTRWASLDERPAKDAPTIALVLDGKKPRRGVLQRVVGTTLCARWSVDAEGVPKGYRKVTATRLAWRAV